MKLSFKKPTEAGVLVFQFWYFWIVTPELSGLYFSSLLIKLIMAE